MASIFSWWGLVQVRECQKTRSDLFLLKLRMLKHQPSNKRHIESKICNGARVTLRPVECVWWLFSSEFGVGGEEKEKAALFLKWGYGKHDLKCSKYPTVKDLSSFYLYFLNVIVECLDFYFFTYVSIIAKLQEDCFSPWVWGGAGNLQNLPHLKKKKRKCL